MRGEEMKKQYTTLKKVAMIFNNVGQEEKV